MWSDRSMDRYEQTMLNWYIDELIDMNRDR